MDMYPKYISPFGYQTGQNRINSYGVNHNICFGLKNWHTCKI